jgi:predicted RNA polymerase sigma factor
MVHFIISQGEDHVHPETNPRTGRVEAADVAYERAIGLEADPAVRRFLRRRWWSAASVR